MLAVAPAARGAVVTLTAAKDAMILGTAAGVDNGRASGMGPVLMAGADGSGGRKRSLVEFDVGSAGIPRSAVVEQVTMTLYLAQVGGSGGGGGGGGGEYPSRTIRLFAVGQAWGEGPSGSPTNPTAGGAGNGYPRLAGDCTWDYAVFDPADPTLGKWTSGGTDLHGANPAAAPCAESTVTSFGKMDAPFTWGGPGMVADVQSWLDGTGANHGWLLASDLEDKPTSFLAFWSKDGAAASGEPGMAPSLTIVYSLPEPGGLVVALGGWVVAGGRRRRG